MVVVWIVLLVPISPWPAVTNLWLFAAFITVVPDLTSDGES